MPAPGSERILAQHDYPAQAASTGITSLGTLDPSPSTPPMLMGASPFRVLRFTAPPVDSIRAEDTLRLSLELEARVGYDRKVSLRAVPAFPLEEVFDPTGGIHGASRNRTASSAGSSRTSGSRRRSSSTTVTRATPAPATTTPWSGP